MFKIGSASVPTGIFSGRASDLLPILWTYVLVAGETIKQRLDDVACLTLEATFKDEGNQGGTSR